MNFKLPHIDSISFVIGFVLASILWLIVHRIVKLIPRLRQSAVENRLRAQQIKDLTREHDLQLFSLRKAQSSHLASSLFPLEKVLIEPEVVSSINEFPSEDEESEVNLIYKVLPTLTETPEALADFPQIKTKLSSVIEAGQQYIALSGNLGSGKTTSLAAITSEMSQQKSSSDIQTKGYLPLFFDYFELVFDEFTPTQSLANSYAKNIKGLSLNAVLELITHADQGNRLVILIDSLDRLSLPELGKASTWIKELQTLLPHTQIIVTCDPYLTGDLESLGFRILPLADWSTESKKQFLFKWANAWNSLLKGKEDKEKSARIFRWIFQERLPATPFDLTIEIWSALIGISEGTIKDSIFNNYLNLVSSGHLTIDGVKALANEMSNEEIPAVKQEKALEILSTHAEFLTALGDTQNEINLENLSSNNKRSTFDQHHTPESLLDTLVRNGFFSINGKHELYFTHQQAYTYFYAKNAVISGLPDFHSVSSTPLQRDLFSEKLLNQTDLRQVDTWLGRNDHPLYRDHFFALSWLCQTNRNDPLRGKIFRSTARLLQDKALPLGLRVRFLNPLVRTEDPSIGTLLSYFSTNPDDSIRQVSAIGLGLIADEKYLPILEKLDKDDSAPVQQSACLSLSKIWSPAAQNLLIDNVFTAEEPIRALCCELFALHAPDGHQMLQEITATDNYLSRKAAISGLVHIHETWANDLLVKLSVEDTQWVVRDSAKYALEHPLSDFAIRAYQRIPVLEDPWTLEKAKEYNVDLSNRSFPSDLLYKIFQNGTTSDRGTALDYLLTAPNPRLVSTLIALTENPFSDFREQALEALFKLSKRGIDLGSND